MSRVLALVVALSLLGPACLGGGDPTPTAPPGGAILRFDGASVAVEVVATSEGRSRGLMHRRHLDEDAGMLFLFPTATDGGFWMKNTLISLSIAYLEWDGAETLEVLRILDMTPCRSDPCRSYPPGLSYDAALEVNSGWFEANGIERGSVAEIEGVLPNPS